VFGPNRGLDNYDESFYIQVLGRWIDGPSNGPQAFKIIEIGQKNILPPFGNT